MAEIEMSSSRSATSFAPVAPRYGEFVRQAQELYAGRCPDLRRKVCPRVRALLNKVSRRGLKAGLVTGNLSAIGWTKVERAGLKHHFAFGAFAEQELVLRAGAEVGQPKRVLGLRVRLVIVEGAGHHQLATHEATDG